MFYFLTQSLSTILKRKNNLHLLVDKSLQIDSRVKLWLEKEVTHTYT